MQEIDLESVEAGDTIEWADEWTSGTKEYEAEVIDAAHRHIPAELTKPEHDVVDLVLDVTKGEESDLSENPNRTEDGHLKLTLRYNE